LEDNQKMNILFLKDLLPTARAGDVKSVKPGFARNYLIPNGLAVLATEEALQRATKLRGEAEVRRTEETKDWKEIAEILEQSSIEIEVRTGPTGRLYGSITPSIISDHIETIISKPMNRRYFNIQEPIRTIGNYKIKAKFVEEVEIDLSINVVPDEESKMLIDEHVIEQEKLKKLEEKENINKDNLIKEKNDDKTTSELHENEDNKSDTQ
tara:strand:+ start:822 stop:1451 length:630 start_codon:yes stop_codon:yes gene_type:complete